jgi:hypothetical protein
MDQRTNQVRLPADLSAWCYGSYWFARALKPPGFPEGSKLLNPPYRYARDHANLLAPRSWSER